jgi:hypothetical protein
VLFLVLVHTPKGAAVVNASLALNEFYTGEDGERQQITTFIDVKIWGPSAENFAKLATNPLPYSRPIQIGTNICQTNTRPWNKESPISNSV